MTRPRTSLARGGKNRRELPCPLVALCGAGLDSVSFRRQLRAELGRLLAFDAYCVNTADPETLLVTSSIGDGLSTQAARRLFEIEEAGGDFNRLLTLAQGPCHVATLSRATAGQLERSERMRELFLPLGWGDELRAALVVGGCCWGYLHLFRETRREPFSAADLARIELARPILAGALRAACLVGEHAAATNPPAVVMLDDAGEVVAESASARSWLDVFAGDVGGAVPHSVHALGSRVRRGAASAAAVARYKTPGGAWLALHGSRVDPGVAVMLVASHAGELAPLLFLAQGLTPREREVGGLLLRGLSNDAIAASLGIALYTVKDHVQVILEKTDSISRTSFVARYAT